MRPEQIGNYIAHFRKKAGLSQTALAERAGVSRNCIALLETQHRRSRQVKLSTLHKIFQALGFGVSVRLIKPKEEAQPERQEDVVA